MNKIRTYNRADIKRMAKFAGAEKLAAKRRMKWGFLARLENTVLTEPSTWGGSTDFVFRVLLPTIRLDCLWAGAFFKALEQT